MEIKPPVAIAIIVVVVVIAGWLLWRSTGSARFKPPPPIKTGTVLQPGQPPAGQAPAGPQVQVNPSAPPPGAPAGGAQYVPGR